MYLEFNDTKSVVPTLKSELLLNGSTFGTARRNAVEAKGTCRELIGVSFRIYDWSDRDEMLKLNHLNKVFLDLDVQDRLDMTTVAGNNPGKAVAMDTSGVLKPYLNEAGKLRYTYSERMYYQIQPIIDLLKEHPDTRQAYLSIWDPEQEKDVFERDRVPCSLGYHFLVRDGKLVMLYYMRSLEVTTCMGNDIYTASKVLEFFADQIGVEPGYIEFMVSSLHFFEEVPEDVKDERQTN